MKDFSTTPDDDTQVTQPAAKPELDTPSSTEAAPAETPEKELPAEAPEAALSPEDAAARKRRLLSLCVDGGMVLLLALVLATAYYIFRSTSERYHVPTPTELLLQESDELDRRYNELLPKANHADTQLHLRARLAQLETQQARLSADIAAKKASLDEHRGQVLAMQYAIRQADETNRSIARSLLPGMPVGNVTTTTGKAYRNATIYRLDKRYIYLRFPEGQVRFPIRHLVKDSLPELARYAFGVLDLVDMSDFEQTGDVPPAAQPAPQPRHSAPAASAFADEGYDPAPGAPVLDADANRTSTNLIPADAGFDQDTWEAPTGDLPM